MARKRIKTLAHEWGVPVEDVLASCVRLRLGHAHSDSSLLSQEETDRVKADLDEQVHRTALLRRETVVETSAGKVLEKRLNATVMRRRHAEPEPGQVAAAPAEPFHFEVESDANDESFATPMFEQPLHTEAELPDFEPDLAEPEFPEPPVMNGADHSAAAEASPAPAPAASEMHEHAAPDQPNQPIAADAPTTLAVTPAPAAAAASAAPAADAPATRVEPVVVERMPEAVKRTPAAPTGTLARGAQQVTRSAPPPRSAPPVQRPGPPMQRPAPPPPPAPQPGAIRHGGLPP